MDNRTSWGLVLSTSTVFAGLCSVSIFIAQKFNQVQSEPYLDEVFHVPQSLAYYNGNFSHWDNKITTLPGLYCISNLFIKSFQLLNLIPFMRMDPNANVYRAVNMLINGLNFWLIYSLLNIKKNRLVSDIKKAFAVLTLSLFPLHYFFSFLYYTDPLSTFFVLHMTLSTRRKRHKAAALSGFCAVLTRQTNIIWIVWNCCIATWSICEALIPEIEDTIKHLFPTPQALTNTAKGVKRKSTSMSKAVTDPKKKLIKLWILCGRKIIPKLYVHAIVILLFVCFVLINGSIVVGDKKAHKATINIPQIFYFALFYGFFTFPAALLNIRKIYSSIKEHIILFIFCIIVGLIIVKINTPVHPYLLADNRHYTFYIWKRVYEWFPIVKYCLVPIYIILLFHICLDSTTHSALTFFTISFIFVALVPQLLLEFRYFIIPYFLLRLNSYSFQWKQLIPEFCLNVLVNYMTINLFLYKPFVWAHTNETQRFMW